MKNRDCTFRQHTARGARPTPCEGETDTDMLVSHLHNTDRQTEREGDEGGSRVGERTEDETTTEAPLVSRADFRPQIFCSRRYNI